MCVVMHSQEGGEGSTADEKANGSKAPTHTFPVQKRKSGRAPPFVLAAESLRGAVSVQVPRFPQQHRGQAHRQSQVQRRGSTTFSHLSSPPRERPGGPLGPEGLCSAPTGP